MPKKIVVITTNSPIMGHGLEARLKSIDGFKKCTVELVIKKDAEYTTIRVGSDTLAFIDEPHMWKRVLETKGCVAVVLSTSDPINLERGIASLKEDIYIDPACRNVAGVVVEESLTDRQKQILQMYADGCITDKIASSLNLSTETIRTHTKRILAKLNASTRSNAIAIGIRSGQID